MRRVVFATLGVLGLVAIGVMVALPLTQADLPPVSDLASQGATAREALIPAAELAAEWREDAALVVASSQRYVAGAQGEETAVQDVEWTFQFYSPSSQRTILVSVIAGQARRVRAGMSPYQLDAIPDAQWRLDSDQALQLWLDGGGSHLLAQRSEMDVVMQLRMQEAETGPRPVWIVVGLLTGGERTFTVTVDAATGEVLP